jgi:DNA-binding IscR family transcriptional regulator
MAQIRVGVFMALATFSTEQIIRNRLAALGCAENSFVRLYGTISRTRFVEAMTGKPGTSLSQDEAIRLLQIIREMEHLQSATDVGIDWSRTARVDIALVIQRAHWAAEVDWETAERRV